MELQQTLNWDIQQLPVSNLNGVINTYKSIARTDNQDCLSVTKKSYQPLLNRTFVEIVTELSKLAKMPIEGYSEYKGGIIVLAYLKNNNALHTIGADKMETYLVVGNSFDQTKPFFIGTVSSVLWCSNQFSRIHSISRIKHSKRFQDHLSRLYSYLDLFTLETKQMVETMNRFGEVEVSEGVKQQCVHYLLDLDKNSGKSISTKTLRRIELLNSSITTECEHFGDNILGLFNGITRYTTHHIGVKKQKCVTFGNLFGMKNDLNQKGYKFCNNLLGVCEELKETVL